MSNKNERPGNDTLIRDTRSYESANDFTRNGPLHKKHRLDHVPRMRRHNAELNPISTRPTAGVDRNTRPDIKNSRPGGQVNRPSLGNRSRKLSHKYSGMGTIWKAPGAASKARPTAINPALRSTKIVAHGQEHKFGVVNNFKSSRLAGPGVWINK